MTDEKLTYIGLHKIFALLFKYMNFIKNIKIECQKLFSSEGTGTLLYIEVTILNEIVLSPMLVTVRQVDKKM